MILLATLLLLAAVLLFVGYPLVRPPAPEDAGDDAGVGDVPAPASGQRERLLAEREHALSTLKELEFEHGIGNLSDEDYAALRAPQRRKAVAILRELDAIGGDAIKGDAAADAHAPSIFDDRALDMRLEGEIARERARLAGTLVPDGAGPSIDDPGATPDLCPVCGTPHAAAARFCAECGHRLRDNGTGAKRGDGGRVEQGGRAGGAREG